MLIYKENLHMQRHFWSKIGDFRACEKTAPKRAQIPLAGQRVIRVQWERPDFDNGMKTEISQKSPLSKKWERPDFDNGMKTQGNFP